MTGHCHVVDFNMLKTMETETKKWSRSPTRVANYRALTGKILVFLNRWSHKQVRLYKLYIYCSDEVGLYYEMTANQACSAHEA